jgi:hypothetical protein
VARVDLTDRRGKKFAPVPAPSSITRPLESASAPQLGDSTGCQNLAAAPLDHMQIIPPAARCFRELPLALESARPKRGRGALIEPGLIAPHAPRALPRRNKARMDRPRRTHPCFSVEQSHLTGAELSQECADQREGTERG